MGRRYFDDVQVGDTLGSLRKGPMTAAHIMRWSAAIENWHRIHYDQGFATGHDGLPHVIVAGSWKQHILAQLLKDWAGPHGWVAGLECQYRGMDACGATLVVTGKVTAVERQAGMGRIHCELEATNDGKVTTTGKGIVLLPLRDGPPLPYPLPEAGPATLPTAPAPAEDRATATILQDWHFDLVGRPGEPQIAPEPVEAGALRRFVQAIMDTDPLYHSQRNHGQRIAPPLFPMHAVRTPTEAPDPLDALHTDPDYDGLGELTRSFGLVPLRLPLKRLLNGGNVQEIHALATIGDRIQARSCYQRIFEKAGKDGPLIFVVIFTRYEAIASEGATPRLLLTNRQTYIWR